MNKIVSSVITLCLAATCAGCANTSNESSTEKKEEKTVIEESKEVTIEMPDWAYVSTVTQEKADEFAEYYGFTSVTLNEDGTSTIVATVEAYEQALETLKAEATDAITSYMKEQPSLESLDIDESYQNFIVHTTNTELTDEENGVISKINYLARQYNAFTGIPECKIEIVFQNTKTGEIIDEITLTEVTE